jgi:hypothetical protein
MLSGGQPALDGAELDGQRLSLRGQRLGLRGPRRVFGGGCLPPSISLAGQALQPLCLVRDRRLVLPHPARRDGQLSVQEDHLVGQRLVLIGGRRLDTLVLTLDRGRARLGRPHPPLKLLLELLVLQHGAVLQLLAALLQLLVVLLQLPEALVVLGGGRVSNGVRAWLSCLAVRRHMTYMA